MTSDLIYLGVFIVMNAVFLFLFPHYIGLNAATNLDKPAKSIDVESYMVRVDRYVLSVIGIIVFSVFLFGFGEGGVAMILGFAIMSIFVAIDYKRIYCGNPEPQERNGSGVSGS